MPKEFSRTRRIGELIQRELADIIRREVTDPHLGMITLSQVKITPDLKTAHVFVTALNAQVTPEHVVKKLNAVVGSLRYQLSQRLSIRNTPRLEFLYDSSIEYAVRLSALIDSVTISHNDVHG
jgi:ribosome-binding factor A